MVAGAYTAAATEEEGLAVAYLVVVNLVEEHKETGLAVAYLAAARGMNLAVAALAVQVASAEGVVRAA